MPAWLLLPAALVCICGSLFTPDFYGSHSNNTGDAGRIYSNRCYNCTLMAPNESHLIDIRDNGAIHCCRLDYSGRVFLAVLRFYGVSFMSVHCGYTQYPGLLE